MIDFIKMELNIFFPDTVRNLLKWTIHANFVPSMRSTWPQKLLLVLWVKCRRVGLDWIHGGDNKKVSSLNTLSRPKAESVSCWVRFILVIDQCELEKEIASLFGDALWINISDLKDTVHCDFWGPNELSSSSNFYVLIKKMLSEIP